MIPGLLRSNKVATLATASVALVLLLLALASQRDSWELPAEIPGGLGNSQESEDKSTISKPGATENQSPGASVGDDEKASILRDFYIKEIANSIVKLDAKTYKPYGAFEWKLPDGAQPKWTEPMGKKMCIFDLDNRPFEEDGQLFGSKVLSWDDAEHIHGLSLGALQHWLYAKIHGYQYYYVKTGEFTDRRGSWKKPFILKRVMEKHESCVYMDSDAIFNHMDLPLEWLMNYWNIDKDNTSMALSVDPPAEHNKDKKGKYYDNTGFIITHHRPVTFDMLKDWAECADEGGKYPGCTEYRTVAFGRPSDQGGFGNYIRYDYADEVQELPCAEANGFPEDHSECVGTFIKHLWSGKTDLIKIAIGQQIPGKFLELFHSELLKDKDNFYFDEETLMSDAWMNIPIEGITFPGVPNAQAQS